MSISLLSEADAQISPSVIWTFDTYSASYGMAAAEDLNNDGIPDIVFGCYRNDGRIYALNGKDGSLLWSFDATVPGTDQGCNDVAVLIYDIDGDSKPEVIVPSSCYARTFCFNGEDGSLRWTCHTRGSDSPPVIADLNEDGRLEILHGEFNGWVRSIDAISGATNWELEVQRNSWIQTAPSITDIDQDGKPDFVVATWSFEQGQDHIYAFRGDDRSLIWKKNISGVVYHGSAIGDIDGDGEQELLLGAYNDTLYCLQARTGETKWTYTAGVNYVPAGPIVIADLNADGQCEIISSAWFRHFALNADGSVKWTYNDPLFGYCFRGAAIADINGDQNLDVVFGTSRGMLRGLSGDTGQPIFEMDLRSDYGDSRFGLDHAPLIADFTGDGDLEIFIVGGYGVIPMEENYGRAYLIKTGSGHGPEWRMFQRDIFRRSNLCTESPNRIAEVTTHSIQALPNPCISELQLVEFPLGASYRILNASGQIVLKGILSTEGKIVVADLKPGIYFLSAYTEKEQWISRFIKM
jgi:outer membrane protein assembly factor BamB